MPAVPADPWSAGLMAAGSVAKAALDDQTNQSLSNPFAANFDNSGWNVNVGAGASQSTQTDRSSSALGLGSLLSNPVVLLGLCAVAYYVLKNR